ncbi:hypothetical protein lbkm_2337 [Lachnospiraceae bacterium KM106-2]|nr:hypothetical protein lbkm_2337 [Lachnospiraceae bacterium KM106-2]
MEYFEEENSFPEEQDHSSEIEDSVDEDSVKGLERRPPQRFDEIRVNNARIQRIYFDGRNTYVTIVYRDQFRPGRDWDDDRGRGRDDDRGRGRDDDDRGRGRDDRRPGPDRNRDQTVQLVVSRRTRIFNENRRPIPVTELQEGMIVSATFSANMTRSFPPQSQAFEIIIQRRPPVRNRVTDGRIIQVDARNQFIIVAQSTQFGSTIRFNINRDTLIFGISGQRIQIWDLFPGLRVRVEHADFMTASIPPQTTAFVIRVIR